MKKQIAVAGAALGLALGAFAGSAVASDIPDPFPASSSTNCAAVGGTTSGIAGVSRSCAVVTEGAVVKEAGESAGFTATTTDTYVQTRDGSQSSTHEVGPMTNPGGKEMPSQSAKGMVK